MTEIARISITSSQYKELFTDEFEKELGDWLQQCTAQGLVVLHSYFREEVLRIAQTKPACPKSREEVEPLVDVFWERWADQVLPGSCSPGPVDRRCPVLAPSAWFRSVSDTLDARYPGVPFADPERVFCMAEVNLRLDALSGRVATLRPPGVQADKDNLALAVLVSAAGARAPILAVSPTDGPLQSDTADNDCFCLTTTNGTLTSRAMRKYVESSLDPYLTANSVPRPILLFVDGLQHHASPALTAFCDIRGIMLVGLPPGGQDLNPTRSAVTDNLAPNVGQLSAMSGAGQGTVSALVADAWQIMEPARRDIKQAFKCCGLFPWSESLVQSWEDPDMPSTLMEVVFEAADAGPPSPPSPLSAGESDYDSSQDTDANGDNSDVEIAHADFESGIPIPPRGLKKKAAIKLLLEAGSSRYDVLTDVPGGRKENVAFLITNEFNINSDKVKFSDDEDGWMGKTTVRSIYLVGKDRQNSRVVHKTDAGGYTVEIRGKARDVDPQNLKGALLVHMMWQVSKWPDDPNYVRRVNWIVSCEPIQGGFPAVAFYEYLVRSKPSKLSLPKKISIPSDSVWYVKPTPSGEDDPESAGFPVPVGGLRIKDTLNLLLDKSRTQQAVSAVPSGRKHNVAYVVAIPQDEIVSPYYSPLHLRFCDGDDSWKLRHTNKYLYLLGRDGSDHRQVRINEEGVFLVYRSVEHIDKSWVPMRPQPSPDDVVVELAQQSSLWPGDPERCLRISWMNYSRDQQQCILPSEALYEYFMRLPRRVVDPRTSWPKRSEEDPWPSLEAGWDWPFPVEGTSDAGFLPCLTTLETIKLLLGKTRNYPVLKELPSGRKDNIAFLVCDEKNVERRRLMQPPELSDDAGPWLDGMTEKKMYHLRKRGVLMVWKNKTGLYCKKKLVDGLKRIIPLEVQPAETEIVEVVRHHTVRDSKTSGVPYKRRVTWLESVSPELYTVPPVALYEYIGCAEETAPELVGDVLEVPLDEVEVATSEVVVASSPTTPQRGARVAQDASPSPGGGVKRVVPLESPAEEGSSHKKLFFVAS